MKSPEMTTADAAEFAVLTRAKRNFHSNGLGNRMWADPGASERSSVSEAFVLSEAQRADFVAAARVEIEAENCSPPPADATASGIKEDHVSLGINALYERRNDALAARNTLIAAGIPKEVIQIIVCSPTLEIAGNASGELILNAEALGRLFQEASLPNEEWEAYRAKLRSGGAMLNLPVEEAQIERAMGILKDHGSVDVERRVATWSVEGWGGTSPVSTEGWGGYSATSTGGTKITASQD